MSIEELKYLKDFKAMNDSKLKTPEGAVLKLRCEKISYSVETSSCRYKSIDLNYVKFDFVIILWIAGMDFSVSGTCCIYLLSVSKQMFLAEVIFAALRNGEYKVS